MSESGIKLPTNYIVTAPRMPAAPSLKTGNPFTSVGDIVVDCDAPGCGWHAFGPRADVKKAWNEHYRQWHTSNKEAVVLLLNHPKQ